MKTKTMCNKNKIFMLTVYMYMWFVYRCIHLSIQQNYLLKKSGLCSM